MRKVALEKKTAGGVILPQSMSSQVNEGVVKAVGPGLKDESGSHIPMELKEGDRVMLPEYGGQKVEGLFGSDEAEYFIYREDDIIAKIE